MTLRMAGKAAIVTGGAGGIGAAVGALFREHGAQVWLVDRSVPHNNDVDFLQADVTDSQDAKRAVEHALRKFGALNVLINNAAYDASKAALIAMTRTLAVEKAAHGIRVNAVRAERKADSLLKRWAEPLEVSYPILWLACDKASYITGTVLMVDGGLSAISL